MSLQITTNDFTLKIVCLTLAGRLDAFEAPALRKRCDELIEKQVYHLVFDLTAVSMIDSAGLAVLVSALKRTRLAGGEVRLIWPREEAAARILKLTKFDQVFQTIEPEQIIPKVF